MNIKRTDAGHSKNEKIELHNESILVEERKINGLE